MNFINEHKDYCNMVYKVNKKVARDSSMRAKDKKGNYINKDKNENVHNITNILNYSDAVIFSIVDRYHAMKRDKYKDSTILIRLPSIHALEYGISYQTKLYLRNIGYKTTHNYLTKIIYGYNRIRLLKKYFKKFKS